MMHQNAWSSDDLATLKKHSTLPLRELQKRFFPDRTTGSICSKIRRECFERGSYRVIWPAHEKAIIWETRKLTIREVRKCHLPHRSLHQIRDRRCEIGIKAINEYAWTDEEDDGLLEAVEDGLTDAETAKQRLPNRTKLAIRKRRHLIMADDFGPPAPPSDHDLLLERLQAEHPAGGSAFEVTLKPSRLSIIRAPLPAPVFTSISNLCSEA